MLMLAEVNWDAVFRAENVMFIGVFGVGGLVAIVTITLGMWSSVRKREMDMRLKREMVAKGYSIDEIERLVQMKAEK